MPVLRPPRERQPGRNFGYHGDYVVCLHNHHIIRRDDFDLICSLVRHPMRWQRLDRVGFVEYVRDDGATVSEELLWSLPIPLYKLRAAVEGRGPGVVTWPAPQFCRQAEAPKTGRFRAFWRRFRALLRMRRDHTPKLLSDK